MNKHDFSTIGQQIAASMKQAAKDMVTEAINLQASVDALVEGIDAQLSEHAKLLDDMDERIHAFGNSVVEAHKKFLNGSGKHP